MTSQQITVSQILSSAARRLFGRVTAGAGAGEEIVLDTDGTLAADSDNVVATQKAVKLYVDTNAGGGGREMLTAARTYYVRTDGSDSNDGLTNTAGGAFLTIQKAINVVATLDLGIYSVDIQVGDGTYTGGAVVNGPWLGTGVVTLKGNAGTPGNVYINTSATAAVTVKNGGALTVKDMKVLGSLYGIEATFNGVILFSGLHFAGTPNSHIRASDGGVCGATGPYTILGGATYHFNATGGVIRTQGVAVTISGTPAFTVFCFAQIGGLFIGNGMTFSAACTGSRYSATLNAVIFTLGGANYFPGDAAGTTATGGQYA